MTKQAQKGWDVYEKKLLEFKKKNSDKGKIQEFINNNIVKKPEKPYLVSIKFGSPYQLKSNLISLIDVSFGYDSNKPILSNVNLGLDMGSKIVLVGPNGSGKSTLIKLMTGEISPTLGEVRVNPQARIGYYNQHFENQLPLDQTPVQFLQSIIPKNLVKDGMVEQSVRSFLGQVKLEPTAHHKLIGELSGGQKARIAIVNLMFKQPHALILDEPTNHLDIETVEALIDALVEYDGGILVITHEPELIWRLNARIWMMDPEIGNINNQIESYEQYCEYILDS
jgi:ATP-binding cassette subfamily F protein 1